MYQKNNVFHFDNVQDATQWVQSVGTGSFDILLAGDGSLAHLVDALIFLKSKIRFVRNGSASIEWQQITNVKCGQLHVDILNTDIIPLSSDSVSSRLIKIIDSLEDNESADLDPNEYPTNYVRALISSKRLPVWTRLERGRLKLYKGVKQKSDAQIIRETIEGIKGSSQEITSDYDIGYIRAVASKCGTSEYKYSVKNLPSRGSFIITKMYYDAPRGLEYPSEEFTRDQLIEALSAPELAMYDAIIAKARAYYANMPAKEFNPVESPEIVEPEYVPQPVKTVVMPAPIVKEDDDFDYFGPADDPDDYDVFALKTPDLSEFQDEEEIEF